MTIPFIKMHGLGNDFVILDQRQMAYTFDTKMIQKISDRRLGIGCDQLIILEACSTKQADVFMKIFNADGIEVNACGNATRCVGSLLYQEDQHVRHCIQTKAGFLAVEVVGPSSVMVDLGQPYFDWQAIPLSQKVDPLHIPITFEGLKDPIALSMGNPHLIFFVYDVESIDLEYCGQALSHHPLFPEGTNVEIVEKVDAQTLRMRVYERGAGITPACGTGACASVVAAQKRNLIESRPITVILDGGKLIVEYQTHVKMTGQVIESFRGSLDPYKLFDQ